MVKIKNKISLSSFSFVLKCFKIIYFPKIFSYFFIFFVFFVLESGLPFCYASSFRIEPNGFGTIGLISRTRIPRSPFFPPTVTSYKPSIRKTSQYKAGSDEKINQSKAVASPPVVFSQSAVVSKNEQNEKRVVINSGASSSPIKSHLPRPPMIFQFSQQEPRINKEDNGEKLSVIPQNDQQLPLAKGEEIVPKNIRNEENEGENREAQIPNIKKETSDKRTPPSYNTFDKKKNNKELAGFNEVLNALDITADELRQILKKINIPLDNFLEFIDSEKTKEEIMKYLNLPESLKNNSYRNDEYSSDHKYGKGVPYSVAKTDDQKFIRVDRQKVLVDHLPFTEIVHDVPLRTQTYKSTYNSDKHTNDDIHGKDKNILDNNTTEKKYKTKRTHQKMGETNPFLMNSGYSTMLPPKDSPIIIPFLPAKRKPTKPPITGTASILSLTIEEKGKKYQTTKMPNEKLPIRNKVMTGTNEHWNTPKSDQRSWDKSSNEQNQANLRMVFPMKGILMFCGILGVVAVVTIIILIIYGSIKCNQKPSSSTYELNTHQECST